MSATHSPFPVVPERIAEIIFALCKTVTARVRTGTLTQAQLTYVVGRLLGIRKRFQGLVARLRAGQIPRERARTPREPEPAPEFPLGFRPPPPGWRRWAVRAGNPVPLWRSLRQHSFAWLLPIAPNVPEFRDSAVAHRAWLLALLAEPETQALLLASRRVGDTLRPLCWMLGIEVSVLYPARQATGSVVDPASPTPAAEDEALNPVAGEPAFPASVTPPPIVDAGVQCSPAGPRAPVGGNSFKKV